MPAKFIIERDENQVKIIELKGHVSYDTTLEFAEILDRSIAEGWKYLLIVPGPIEVLNSLAIGILFSRRDRLKSEGGVMAMAQVSNGLKKLLSITRFDTLVPLYTDIKDALHAMPIEAASCN